MNKLRTVTILLAEDDDGHAELIIEGLKNAGLHNTIIRFSDGLELWNYLKNKLGDFCYEDAAHLILLDINMPKLDGVEVLRRIKSEDCLKNIPVIMLTTTDDPREVENCYRLGCNFYITKPLEFSKFAETLRRLGLFVQVVSL